MSGIHKQPTFRTASSERLRPGLTVLLHADSCAQELGLSVMQLATDISELTRTGMSTVDIRWLCVKHYLAHLHETTRLGQHRRSFVPGNALVLSSSSCFYLTPSGRRFAADMLKPTEGLARDLHCPQRSHNAASDVPATPACGNAYRRELRVEVRVVRRFERRAPNQETVLATFDEDQWPTFVDDPLPPRNNVDRYERLHDTIKRLNQGQAIRLIQFHGDGTGERIGWRWRRNDERTCLLLRHD